MFRQYISIFFLALSQAMLLGHSIFPHHHHDPLDIYSNHSHSCEHHHGNEHDTDGHHSLDIFSLIQHGNEGLECISCPHMDQPVQKQLFVFESLFSEKTELIINLPITGQNISFYYHSFFTKTLELLPDSLRAPPSQV